MPQQHVPDRVIAQKITQALINHGLRCPCRIDVSVRRGDVTLSGTIQYPNQRRNAVRTAQMVSGVHRVIDDLKIEQLSTWANDRNLRQKMDS